MTITINRGKLNIIEFIVPGDQTNNKLIFVICDSEKNNANQLIAKRNSLNGGSEEEIKTIFLIDKTKLTITILPEETADFSDSIKIFGIDSIDPMNLRKVIPLKSGFVKTNKLQPNPFNGVETLPPNSPRMIVSPYTVDELTQIVDDITTKKNQVQTIVDGLIITDPSQFDDNAYIKKITSNGAPAFIAATIAELQSDLEIYNFMKPPVTNNIFSNTVDIPQNLYNSLFL